MFQAIPLIREIEEMLTPSTLKSDDPVESSSSMLETVVGRAWCLRCLLLVMCTHPFAKKVLTLHLARSEGHERYFGCNLMHRKVLALSYQHLMAEAPHRTGYLFLRGVQDSSKRAMFGACHWQCRVMTIPIPLHCLNAHVVLLVAVSY